MQYKPHGYQVTGIKHLHKNKNSALFLDMGLGKSSITLTVFEELINSVQIRKPLIVATKFVTEQTWKAEIEKWDHTSNLTISRIIGTEKQRIAALHAPADIYAVSRDNINWLVMHCLKQKKKIWPFDALIIDELSSFKNPQSRRFKALRKVAPLCDKVVGLTGTPAPNGLLDLWSQIYLLDGGERLGRTLTAYREEYFIADYNGYGYTLKPGADLLIHAKLMDLCLSMKSVDYLDLPGRLDIYKTVTLKSIDKYKEFKKKKVLELEGGLEDITPLSAAGMYSKLSQFCNGAVYDSDRNWHLVDDSKLEALVESYEELNGNPVIIFYNFQSDKERILAAIPEAEHNINIDTLEKWNRGEVKCLIAHPASIGHGLNLQSGGHYMFWFGIPSALELYQQAVARLDRQGQKEVVRNVMFITEGTIEYQMAQSLNNKADTQDSLMEALKKHLIS